MTAETVPAHRKPQPVLWNGEHIKGRWLQTRVWGAILGVLVVGLIAGIYFALWQVNWYVHVGPVHFGLFNLKRSWDGGTWWPSWLGHWADYRHYAFRDELEPAVATLIVLSLLAGEKYWKYRLPAWQVAVRVVAVLVLAIGLGVLGVYLRDFGLPGAWAHSATAAGHPGYNLRSGFGWAGKISLFTLAWGALMGFVLHRLWAPAGATIQGYWTDRLADRGRGRKHPAWYIRWPFSPPVVRERYSELYLHPEITIAKPGKASRWLIGIITFVVVLLVPLGLLAKWGIGAHHVHVPYLAPKG